MLSPLNTLRLYGRNFKGYFFGGFAYANTFPQYVDGAVWLGHLFTVIPGLIVFPFIKTLVDFFSRKPLPKEEMAKLNNNVASMDESVTKDLVNTILEYEPQSESSKGLRDYLKALNEQAKTAEENVNSNIQIKHNGKVLELKKEQANEVYQDPAVRKLIDIKKIDLDSSRQEQLKKFDDQFLNPHQKNNQILKEMVSQKISEYLNTEKNQGKKMEHIIYNFFQPQVNKVSELPSKAPESFEFSIEI